MVLGYFRFYEAISRRVVSLYLESYIIIMMIMSVRAAAAARSGAVGTCPGHGRRKPRNRVLRPGPRLSLPLCRWPAVLIWLHRVLRSRSRPGPGLPASPPYFAPRLHLGRRCKS